MQMDALAPIDEEPSEAGDLASNSGGGAGGDDDEQPITMIPRIMHTAPSPTADTPLSVIGGARGGPQQQQPNATTAAQRGGTNGDVSQIESVL